MGNSVYFVDLSQFGDFETFQSAPQLSVKQVKSLVEGFSGLITYGY